MKGILPKYFADEWSFAKFKVPKEDNSQHYTCAFNKDGTALIVVSSEGHYYLATIPKSKGYCKMTDHQSLI